MNGDVIYASVLPQEIIRKNQSNCEQKSAFYIINTRQFSAVSENVKKNSLVLYMSGGFLSVFA